MAGQAGRGERAGGAAGDADASGALATLRDWAALNDFAALDLWRRALMRNLADDGADLTQRQLALLLTVYLTPPPHTVRGLAAQLDISKPAVTRALDRLAALGFAKRKPEPDDRRGVEVQRTVKGAVYLRAFGAGIAACAREVAENPLGVAALAAIGGTKAKA